MFLPTEVISSQEFRAKTRWDELRKCVNVQI